jgi:hypothetical protein
MCDRCKRARESDVCNFCHKKFRIGEYVYCHPVNLGLLYFFTGGKKISESVHLCKKCNKKYVEEHGWD